MAEAEAAVATRLEGAAGTVGFPAANVSKLKKPRASNNSSRGTRRAKAGSFRDWARTNKIGQELLFIRAQAGLPIQGTLWTSGYRYLKF